MQQHKDLATQPSCSSLVLLKVKVARWLIVANNRRHKQIASLQVKVSLPHWCSDYYDELLWDLAAPRAACEAYLAMVCNEIGLDWHAHSLIMRQLKDAIDAAAKVGLCGMLPQLRFASDSGGIAGLQDLETGNAQLVPAPSTTAAMVRSPPSKLPQVVPWKAAAAAQAGTGL